MLTVILAALLGVVGIVAVLAYVKKTNSTAFDNGKAVSVLVASGSIPQGTSLNQAVSGNLLIPKRYPKGAIPAGAVTKVTPTNGKLVTTSAMQPGQLLLTSMLVRRGAVSGAIAVPTGDMAVAVEVCLEAAIAGYIQPGAKVALFDTYATGSANLQTSCDSSHQGQPIKAVTTRLVLRDALVLSVSAAAPSAATVVSQSVTSVSPGASAASQGAVFVTLAVDQNDAEQLILASQAGLPYFALLTPGSVTTRDAGSQLFSSKP
jgi:pilus assembly protein CpaB